jgi:hypothetical protein
MAVDSIAGGCLAFVCAGIAVGSDAQTEVRARFGRRYGTFILRTSQGFLFMLLWGVVDVGFYIAFLYNHDWAKRAFNIEVEQNLIWMGVVVGLSAILIIRTNLATVNGFQIGGELVYTWSRATLIDNLNRARLRARRAFLSPIRPFARNATAYPAYFTSLRAELIGLAAGSDKRAEIEAQLNAIETAITSPHTPDTSATARESITGLVYDYFGPDEVSAWATDSDYGNI